MRTNCKTLISNENLARQITIICTKPFPRNKYLSPLFKIFFTLFQISKLQSWCKDTVKILKTNESYETVDEVEETMDKMDDLKLEVDGKEEKFAFVVEAGEQMVEEGHHATEEVSDLLPWLYLYHVFMILMMALCSVR